MENKVKGIETDVKKHNKTEDKKKYRKNCENMYLYVQIVISVIMVFSAFLLKGNNSNAFYAVRDDYKAFFTIGEIKESNFSYNSFLESLSDDIKEKYRAFTQTVAYLYGKGKNDTYPSDISFEKYVPEEKGIKPVKGVLTSEFGIRTDPFNKKSKDLHTGIDIAAAKGTFIKASFEGKVIETGYTDVAGNYIKIETNENLHTFYGHTQFVFVKQGDYVLKGQVIATVGDTGMVTGPHLHFEVLYDGNRVNPVYTIE
ncbi:MAG: M23 family metallopeptidase [Ruminococcaceae bacterium]|nr:M23 family metallopeptidase [Oscillospiraceae bacterium]